ncbi:heterokaryon incompatibility protein-domain-containing protein [Lasiosphaeria miniovina]|uniref:Heterokaryon incompatibility protein-domain-containing protein n=1 Tax=Lasiosphaeria miniovina TaxID=1954250 RepID=A0AA39ZQT3_9PEZI|nr:heterokaryon incompatibility protein-domain-containing protein [Lasiosphaeria miniovina]KAK0701936.1 heterokaryon incompatibility protein-domain-containing protein [Lasiosphaeria miniovina]
MSTLSGSVSFCVICAKTLLLFDGMQKHVSFEETLRTSLLADWRLTWKFETPATVSWHQFSKQAARVALMVKHKRGYSWGIGSFMLHPDPRVALPGVAESERKSLPEDYGTVLETMAKVASWMQECFSTHKKCQQLFGKDGPGLPVAHWFPDRLIRITRTESSGSAWLNTRLVLKSDLTDFPADTSQEGVQYLSFSHCWGPEPKGGRGGSVLTQVTINDWHKELPLDRMPLAFRHAVRVCASLGFDHIWIDSLCILQDSVRDWQEQSAVMADVYKFAWLNIAALSTGSDYEGFINEAREPRAIFGFRAPLAPILGVANGAFQGRACALLDGNVTLLWDIQRDLPGGGDWLAPLFTRAWVYQERSLARRTLAFATHGVFFACDEASYGENLNGMDGVSTRGFGSRHLLHSVTDKAAALAAEAVAAGNVPSPERLQQEALNLFKRFGSTWNGAVSDYTKCKLTKDTDRLVAISSIARELANSRILGQKRYLAGLWDINLIYQLGWMANGRDSPGRRKHVGAEGYVAPSWSWASVEVPVTTCGAFYPDPLEVRALTDVRAADVELATEFPFGPVSAGWVRLRGCPKAISGSFTKPNYDYEGSSGYEMVASRAGLSKVVWVPHMLTAHSSMVSCSALVFAEVTPGEESGCGGTFVKPGEKVYRRLGTGNFGRIPSLFRNDKLVMALGTFPDAPR